MLLSLIWTNFFFGRCQLDYINATNNFLRKVPWMSQQVPVYSMTSCVSSSSISEKWKHPWVLEVLCLYYCIISSNNNHNMVITIFWYFGVLTTKLSILGPIDVKRKGTFRKGIFLHLAPHTCACSMAEYFDSLFVFLLALTDTTHGNVWAILHTIQHTGLLKSGD